MASQIWVQLVDQAGTKNGVPFMVPPGINVADFKEKVKEKKKPRLDWLAADELVVYKNKASFEEGKGQAMIGSASVVGLGKDDEDENVVWVVVPDATSGKFSYFC
jgi:hypothetical protein